MLKNISLTLLLIFSLFFAFAQDSQKPFNPAANDSVKLEIEGSNAYYQHTVKLDSGTTENKIYLRALEFMAAKNFQQNYGYEEEGKLICTTTQDLNNNQFTPSGENDQVDPFTVQFAITVDMKNRRYRYTINNVTFYFPSESGNIRLSLYELYQRSVNTDSRRIARNATAYLNSFERYLATLTYELYQSIQQKRKMDDAKF